MPYRKTAILVGLLFISSTVTFAAGSSLVHAYFSDTTPSSETLFGGVFLEWYTASAVAVIGIALFPVLKPHGQNLSAGYLILRAMEGAAIIAVGVYFLVSRHQFEDYVLLVYILSGSAGLILSYLLLRSGLVARWLSMLGIAGYAALLAGVLADMSGTVSLATGAGIAFLVPGGLFEMAFPLLLIFRGWRSVDPVGCKEDSRAGVVPGGPRG
ncbi:MULTISPECIES: DUF4386 domain-containing protein [Streptomyces]|uniref:DUF4386 domain-containing protein n=2 Tax=Streptomyces rimosus subsp. rimosus TaxID=132474 RepID=L8F019_STRR1|nr:MULTISPECIES: DUF4386 domain-containing protein [Streptomyces]KOG74995.1 hypothetical protein ADK78_13580 [Kitasatospora aureofaciens]MYT41796.1 DUF4386 family protein [Streptomyces sp. SID5471]KOT41793.1 hypothetical protein ADK84_10605 [Streptomyces sp. NRRL WC-3701]KOT43950.1 hypothetical protein ADK42_06395 [Streptomyces rimosus subsp. rimosus]KOT67287.1 hypothetical protein ADK44_03775 [Streptomyces rimosus subsp. rimosus]